MNKFSAWFAARTPGGRTVFRHRILGHHFALSGLGCGFLALVLGCQPGETAKTVSETNSPKVAAVDAPPTTSEPEDQSDTEIVASNSGTPHVADGTSNEDAQTEASKAKQMLPEPSATGETETPILDEDGDGLPDFVYDKPIGEERARTAFQPPPGAKALTKSGRLWVDPSKHRVYIDGYVTMNRGPLEMLACPFGTKEHESIVAVLAKSREVHTALLAIGANQGTPVRFRPEFLPPTGQVIRTYVCWYDKEGEFKTVDAREWIKDLETQKAMTVEWVFAGSGFWQDPQDKREYYQADQGDMICVSNFSSAMMDVAIPSSADAGALRFETFDSRIPELDTPVRLILVPIPEPTDDGEDTEETKQRLQMPTTDDVPQRE